MNFLKFPGCLHFQLHFQNGISLNSFMKSVDEKIIFINICDLSKNNMINQLYLVHTLIYNIDIYKAQIVVTKCFHMICIIIVKSEKLQLQFRYAPLTNYDQFVF